MSEQLVAKIQRLKRERNAVILAHNYQLPEVQDVADYVGDSFELSRKAAATDAEVIVFCGVHFMAESAFILAPHKTVLLPERLAGCPLAETITEDDLRRKKREYPEATVVCYVNSSAAVKAESDICCTSSNAVQVVNSLPSKQVLFVPDANLAHWVAGQTDKEIIPWRGHCVTHHRVTEEDVRRAREAVPGAVIAVHPECRPEVAARADFVGSTSALLRFARETDHREIVVGTEMGILHRMKKENPHKKFYLLSPGLICPNMKMTTLDKVARALERLEPRITVPEGTRLRAAAALEKMLAVT
ncbi:quinolinate synthase NadA [Calderihabitans maritimus]|uniref:Quinolinate synthase n=1 Tax=Calderihabitans maritimus TaxID=1246530 RepID=A0A1Z5HXT3_9FIRM|nr:quinolinate synthase NadA [Calderihabitans maritimus]GAW94090.1 quinolinate synthetase [Calderihabitans maritimus]